jgi:hypothetical protein
MTQNVFYSDLNDFCRKNLVKTPNVQPPDPLEFASQMYRQQTTLFEHLLLFDKITLKVTGEAIPLAVLIGMFGQKTFDALVEQGAFEFTLWTQEVMYLVKNIPGIDALASGNFNTPEYGDPERSIETGLAWARNAPTGRKRRQLVRRLLPLFRITENNLAENALKIIRESLRNGGLEPYGIPKVSGHADSLNDVQKRLIAKCGQDFAEYDFLMRNGMTSFSDYRYFSPFWSSAERFRTMNRTISGFSSMSKLEGVPDLKALFAELKSPLQRLPKIRKTANARNFRTWLEETAGQSPDTDMVKAYLDSISERRGMLDSTPRKLLKTVVLAAVGIGVGATAGGHAGAVVGAAAAPIVEKVAEFATDTAVGLLDNFVLDRVSKGWSPRMFFDDLSQLRRPVG